MKRSSLLWLISSSYIACSLIVLGWTYHLWDSSVDIVQAGVRGVSTTSLEGHVAVPTLLSYPLFHAGQGFSVAAKQAVLYDQDTGYTLYSQGLHLAPIASTTKMMTAVIATKQLADMQMIVTVSTRAAGQIPSRLGLYEGERISAQALLTGMLLISGNDAANALAEEVGGILLNKPDSTSEQKVQRFVQEMNATAKRLHMENTQYLDPAGLDDNGHSTALDLAKLAGIYTTQPVISHIITQETTQVSDTLGHVFTLENSNRLVKGAFYPGIQGGKTGYTPHTSDSTGAGHCLVATAFRNGHHLTAVVLDTYSDDTEASQQEARNLLDAGFSNTSWQ